MGQTPSERGSMGVFKNTKEAFERGMSGDSTYEIADSTLVCSHCGHTDFALESVLLNTRGMSFIGLDWANEDANAYICKNCGHIEWFVQR